MLQSNPTKNGTGIEIYGFFDELDQLYDTTHKIVDTLDENNPFQKGQYLLLMNFAYEVRKAKDHSRLIKEVDSIDGKKQTLLGFQLVWTDIIIFISTLRRNAGFIVLTNKELLILNKLEILIADAAKAYDEKGAENIEELLACGVYIGHKYIFNLYQTIHIQFVLASKGKRRFRNIPDFLWNHLSPKSMTTSIL